MLSPSLPGLVVDSYPILRVLDESPDSEDSALRLDVEAELSVNADRVPLSSLVLDCVIVVLTTMACGCDNLEALMARYSSIDSCMILRISSDVSG